MSGFAAGGIFAAIIRFVAKPLTSEGQRVASTHLAQRFLEKLDAHEMAELTAEWKEQQRRRITAETQSKELDVESRQLDVEHKKLELLKLAIEVRDSATRWALEHQDTDDRETVAAADDRVSRAISRIVQKGGGSPLLSREQQERLALPPVAAQGTVQIPIGASGKGTVDQPGHAPTVVVAADVASTSDSSFAAAAEVSGHAAAHSSATAEGVGLTAADAAQGEPTNPIPLGAQLSAQLVAQSTVSATLSGGSDEDVPLVEKAAE